MSHKIFTYQHKDVSLKVVLWTWHLFRDRLPTKDNFCRRGVIGNDSRLCFTVCGYVETSAHLFLHCNNFGSGWYHIYCWIGISSAVPFHVSDHFMQFGAVGGVSKGRQSILQVISFATVWKIWKERNNMLFNGTKCSIVQVVIRLSPSLSCEICYSFPQLSWLVA